MKDPDGSLKLLGGLVCAFIFEVWFWSEVFGGLAEALLMIAMNALVIIVPFFVMRRHPMIRGAGHSSVRATSGNQEYYVCGLCGDGGKGHPPKNWLAEPVGYDGHKRKEGICPRCIKQGSAEYVGFKEDMGDSFVRGG